MKTSHGSYLLFLFLCVVLNADGAGELKRILVVGGAICDMFVHYDKADSGTMSIFDTMGRHSYLMLKEGLKIDISKMRSDSGGGASNASVAFKRLGCESSICSRVGDDRYGKMILEGLCAEGVATDYMTIDADMPTGIAFVIPSLQGDRTILVQRGASAKMSKADVPLDALSRFSCLYITSLSGESASIFGPLVKAAHEHGLLVASNPGSSQLRAGSACMVEYFPAIDIFMVNATEATTLLETMRVLGSCDTPSSEKKVLADGYQEHVPQLFRIPLVSDRQGDMWLEDFIRIVGAKGPRIIIVTNGSEGAYVGDVSSRTIYFHPSFPATVVNTIGAGDAFGATFVARMVQGFSVESALRDGVINSASVVSYEDAKTGLLTAAMLRARALSAAETIFVQKRNY